MASIMQTIKKWLGKQESETLQYEQRHKSFSDMQNRGEHHKEHMMDRIEDAD